MCRVIFCSAGDSVWVVPGVNGPLILRRTAAGRFRLVGEAYVDGIMHGGALSNMGLFDMWSYPYLKFRNTGLRPTHSLLRKH